MDRAAARDQRQLPQLPLPVSLLDLRPGRAPHRRPEGCSRHPGSNAARSGCGTPKVGVLERLRVRQLRHGHGAAGPAPRRYSTGTSRTITSGDGHRGPHDRSRPAVQLEGHGRELHGGLSPPTGYTRASTTSRPLPRSLRAVRRRRRRVVRVHGNDERQRGLQPDVPSAVSDHRVTERRRAPTWSSFAYVPPTLLLGFQAELHVLVRGRTRRPRSRTRSRWRTSFRPRRSEHPLFSQLLTAAIAGAWRSSTIRIFRRTRGATEGSTRVTPRAGGTRGRRRCSPSSTAGSSSDTGRARGATVGAARDAPRSCRLPPPPRRRWSHR